MSHTARERSHSTFRCPHCGSDNVRRSLPRSLFEDIVRSLTPYHLYFCRDCEGRGWKIGALKLADGATPTRPAFGRPLEPRDTTARRRRWRRLVLTVIIAIGLGVATGVRLHSCAQQSALPAGSE